MLPLRIFPPVQEIRALTIGERIVVHLSQYVRVADAYVCPLGMSQAGIATSLGISRAHAAIELRRQMTAGRIETRVAHVFGEPTRRKVYWLTPRGDAHAQSVRARALDRTVTLVRADGTADRVSGACALDALRKIRMPEGRAVLLVLTHSRIDLRDARIRLPSMMARRAISQSVEAQAAAAFRRRFLEPVAWQLEVVLGPPHVPPVPAAS